MATDKKYSALTIGRPALFTDLFAVERADGTNAQMLFSDLFLPLGYENNVTAHAGGGQASSTVLTSTVKFHRVGTCATAADSISFGAATVANDWQYVRNDGVAACQLFGVIGGTDTINGAATGTGISIPAGCGIFLVSTATGKWTTTALAGGTNSGDETTTTIGNLINAATAKTTPVDADYVGLMDSAASNLLKKLSWANIKATLIGTAMAWTSAQRGVIIPLTDASTIAVDASTANNFFLAIAGNRTLGVPTNLVAGQQGTICVRQDTTGSRTLAYAWCYRWAGGTAGTLSTVGCSEDQLVYSVDVYGTSTVTITNASPGVMTWTAHGLTTGQQIQLTTTGSLNTGLTASTTYFFTRVDANSGKFSTTLANCAAGTFINTSSTGSGTQTATAVSIKLALNKAYA